MQGWSAFTLSYLGLTFAVFAPGYLALRCTSLGRKEALCAAPLISAALLAIEGILYSALGISASWISIVALPSCLLLAILLLVRKHNPVSARDREALSSWMPLLFYVAVSLIFVIFMFAGNLDGAASFQPDNDNATHLNIIKTMAASGNYSILHTSSYLPGEISPHPNGDAGFYPAIFHAFAAISVSWFGISVSLAENAMAAVIISLIYPLGFYLFFRTITESEDTRLLLMGAIVVPIIQAFPWKFLTWGPLFPNLLSFALIPASLALLALALKNLRNRSLAIRWIILFCIGAIAITASHPNGLFTLAIFAAAFLLHFIVFDTQSNPLKANASRCGLAAAVFAMAVCCWILVYRMPFMQGVVQFAWEPYLSSIPEAIINVLSLKLTSSTADVIGSLLLVIGICHCIRNWRQCGWMILVFGFTAIQAVGCSILPDDSGIRTILCGFWYNDPNRIAANVGLAAVPIITCGLNSLFSLFAGHQETSKARLGTEMAVVCSILAFSFMLVHITDGSSDFSLPTDDSEATATLIGYKYGVSAPKGYDQEEQQFVDEALSMIPENALILNVPSDGSCFAYSLQNANVYWRTVVVGTETPEATLIRTHLADIASYSEVKAAASAIDAHYLLLLDIGTDSNDLNRILPVYKESEWEGLNTVTEDTPGFTLLLAKDDMRLYRIDY